MTVAERLRLFLIAERSAGRGFDAAWRSAVSQAVLRAPGRDREAWRDALHGTRDAWERAYEGRASTAQDQPFLRLAA